MLYLILGAVVVSAGGLLFAVLTMFQRGNEAIEDRLTSLTQNSGRGAFNQDATKPSLLKSPLLDTEGTLEEKFNRFFPITKMLEQSGTGIQLPKLLVMMLAFGGVTGVLTFMFFPAKFKLLSIVCAMMTAPLPFFFVWWRKNKRMDSFGKQLPAAMDLMGQALRAGQSLPSAIQLVGDQLAEPLGPEFRRAFEQQNLGVSITDTLRDMTDRVPNLDLRFFATAVILQRQTGGDLAEILDKISHLTRERYQIKGQIQSLTGEGRISGIVLLGLPPVLFVVMMRLNYDYVMTLFEHPVGQMMLGVAILLQFVGAFAIKKIIDIKV
jgi:tight adherence protein B